MSKKTGKQMIVGLDIGTSKVVAIVAEIGDDGELEIVGGTLSGNSATGGVYKREHGFVYR